jgi:hypothetical protein
MKSASREVESRRKITSAVKASAPAAMFPSKSKWCELDFYECKDPKRLSEILQRHA